MLSIVVAGTLLSGCATSFVRQPFTEVEQSNAIIEWAPSARIWADAPSDAILDWANSGLSEEAVADNGSISVLALSGGGDKGAFGAGLLEGWSQSGSRPQFDVVTGVSTGALIAPFAFLGPAYDEELRRSYTEVEASDIYRPRDVLSGLFGISLADTEPLRERIGDIVDRDFLAEIAREWRSGRGLFVLTTNLDAQRPVLWNMGLLAASDDERAPQLFRDILIASASIPGAFPPVLIEAQAGERDIVEMHVDGGLSSQILLVPEPFLIDAAPIGGDAQIFALVNNTLAAEFEQVKPTTLPIARRGFSTLIKSHSRASVSASALLAKRGEIDLRVAAIGTDFPLRQDRLFDPTYMNTLWLYGFELGRSGAFQTYEELTNGQTRPAVSAATGRPSEARNLAGVPR